jgi:hypothetical protein
MSARRRDGRGGKALWLLLVVLLGGLVVAALWYSGKLPLANLIAAALSDAGDGDAPTADASTPPVKHQTGPLSSAQLSAPLVNGAWVTACGAADTMKVVVKLDVKGGRAVKVDVKTEPPDAAVAACIERAARDLRWDVSPKTDHVTVRY